jgi:hypothetical protein
MRSKLPGRRIFLRFFEFLMPLTPWKVPFLAASVWVAANICQPIAIRSGAAARHAEEGEAD